MSIWLSKISLLLLHPFFVSMTELHYVPAKKTVEVSVRIFTDDLENTIRAHHPGQKVDILHPAHPALVNSWVNAYIRGRLQIKINGAVGNLSFVGYEQQSESTWCYFEIKNIPSVKDVQVFNTLLYDYKKEQINMVRVENGTKEQSSKLEFPDNTVRFGF